MFAHRQYTKEITCPLSHTLIQINDLCQLHEGQSYKQNAYICNTCRGRFSSTSDTCSHCMLCKFDLCPTCFEAQKLVQINCPQGHPLLKVRALKEFSDYTSNRYRCNSCRNSFDSPNAPSAHCKTCKYDLCPNAD